MLRIRIVVIDQYTCNPVPNFDTTYSLFRDAPVKQVNIIRIFGIAEGEKCCLHVHGFFPYFSIQAGKLPPDKLNNLQALANELDQLISMRMSLTNNRGAQQHHIYKIEKILSTNFYGFHPHPELFLRFYFYSEQARKHASSIIRSGKFLNCQFDLFESHFSCITQFFVNYNLFGMNFVNISAGCPRGKSSDLSQLNEIFGQNVTHFPRDKISSCSLELDCSVEHILNAKQAGCELNPGLGLIWDEERDRRKQLNLNEDLFKDIVDCTKRHIVGSDLEREYFRSLQLCLQQNESQDLQNTLRVHEALTQSQAWQDSLRSLHSRNQARSQQQIRSQEVRSHLSTLSQNSQTAALCTQDVLNLLRASTSFQLDEDLVENILSDEHDETGEVGGELSCDSEEEELNQMRELTQIASQNMEQLHESSLNDDSPQASSGGRLFNLNAESVLFTPESAHAVSPSSDPTPISFSDESLLFGDELNEQCESIGHVSNEQCLFLDEYSIPSFRLSQLNSQNSQEMDLFRNEAASTPNQGGNTSTPANNNLQLSRLNTNQSRSQSSAIRTNISNVDFDSIYSFYNFDSQISTQFSPFTPNRNIGSFHNRFTKRRRINFHESQLLFANVSSYIEDENPAQHKRNMLGQNDSDFVNRIKKMQQQESQTKGSDHVYQYLTIMALEIFALSENEIKPDPEKDPVKMIFYEIYCDSPPLITTPSSDQPSTSKCSSSSLSKHFTGAILCKTDVDCLDLQFSQAATSNSNRRKSATRPNLFHQSAFNKQNLVFKNVRSELLAIEHLLEVVRKNDPDILVGFEVETSSWGYLQARASKLGIDCNVAFSRLKSAFFVDNADQSSQSRSHLNQFSDGFTLGNRLDEQPTIGKKDAGVLKTNNYLRRNFRKQQQPFNMKNLIDKLSNLKDPDMLKEEDAANADAEEVERELENFFSLSYVSPCYMSFTGRIMLNLWRLLRKELTLTSYTFENVYFHVYNRRVPHYSYRQLSEWFISDNHSRWRVFEYFFMRVHGCFDMLWKLNIIGLNSELARVFGIQFSDVISKGTQFRVESLLYRATIKQSGKRSGGNNKSSTSEQLSQQDFMLMSCDFNKRRKQHEPEMVPFVMDPFAGFYTDPVAVLDFQSLYPSVIIGYNYCYSTCLGRLDTLFEGSTGSFGCSTMRLDAQFLKRHINDITISPNGLVFLKKHVRKGILGVILEELLNTRVMVKNSIKLHSKADQLDERLLKQLDARQLGLKLIANVTYGYTASCWSGRMPCVELADAIISKGRETLMQAISFVQNNKAEFNGEVIYGDTDSLFIRFCLPLEEAFKRAQQICDRITQSNPSPIKIKLEKIYNRSVLLTKKRYAGLAIDSPDDLVPRFECKGIETVRRDSIPLVKRILDKALRLLFSSQYSNPDLLSEELRPYFESEFINILKNHRRNLSEFIFAREYRGVFGYRPGILLPSMIVAEQLAQRFGENCRPFSKQRVPYVVVVGDNRDPIRKLVRLPLDLMMSDQLRLNCTYYIERVLIPPLQRVFRHLNLDLVIWYRQLPGKSRYLSIGYDDCRAQSVALYFQKNECYICNNRLPLQSDQLRNPASFGGLLCDLCLNYPKKTSLEVLKRLKNIENEFLNAGRICMNCTSVGDLPPACDSIDCNNLFRFKVAHTQMLKKSDQMQQQLNELAIRFLETI